MKQPNFYYLTTKTITIITLIVITITILSIWLFGLGKNRTLFENSILSTSILSLIFFLFITIGLYQGVKLKDNIGKITDKINTKKLSNLDGADFSGMDIPEGGDGIAGVIIGIILWILFSFVLLFVLYFLGTILWILILVFAAMLYWIFFRALRLVFKNSSKCRGNLALSAGYGLLYTILYNCWIYGIIFASHYFLK